MIAKEDNAAARHDRLMQILADALETPGPARAAFLERACEGDAALRAAVEKLLGKETAAAAALNTQQSHAAVMSPLGAPGQIGDCRIIRELGSGGMSVVYLAMQQSPVRRAVAVKLLLPGMDTREIIARFESERQALARMSHPNIAQVYDAGATTAGRPYFIMEYVDGVSITQFCDDRRLTTRQRLEIFLPVCQAVQHAHQKAIIHRDLKPSNVLVAEREGRAIPKVIDFGIAKAIEPGADDRTLVTQHGQFLGTPEYMSPEQAQSGGADVDTRTDVYSLGVMLYELLTGMLPFDAGTLRGGGYDEIRKMIQDVVPPRPSTRLSARARQTGGIAQSPHRDDRAVVRHIRGDLDWITMKALEKERTRRYGSPAELAADIVRHLCNEPVAARPPTTAYRVQKFVRRHRGGVAAALLVAAALIAGVVGTSWSAYRAARAERLARQEQAVALAQKHIAERRFQDVRRLAGSFIFEIDEAILNKGPTRARQQLVSTAIEYLDALSAESPDLELARELMESYGRVGTVQYYTGQANLGDPAGAKVSYRKSLELAQMLRAHKPDDRNTINDVGSCWYRLAEAHVALREDAEAMRCWDEAQKIYQSLVDRDPNDWLARRNVALVISRRSNDLVDRERFDDALLEVQRCLQIRESLLSRWPDKAMLQKDVRMTQSSLGSLLTTLGRQDEALVQLSSALESAKKALAAATQPDRSTAREIAVLQHRMAEVLMDVGRPVEALEYARDLVALRRREVSDDPANYDAKLRLAGALYSLGDAIALVGPYAGALAAEEESLRLRREALSAAPVERDAVRWVSNSLWKVASMLRSMGRYEAALSMAQEAAGVYEKRLAEPGAGAPVRKGVVSAWCEVAHNLSRLGRHAEAIDFARRAVAGPPTTQPATSPTTGENSPTEPLMTLGEVAFRAGDYEQSRAAFAEAVQRSNRSSDRFGSQARSIASRAWFIRALTASHRAHEARQLMEQTILDAAALAARYPQGRGNIELSMLVRRAEFETAAALGDPARAAAARQAMIEAARGLLADPDFAAAREVVELP